MPHARRDSVSEASSEAAATSDSEAEVAEVALLVADAWAVVGIWRELAISMAARASITERSELARVFDPSAGAGFAVSSVAGGFVGSCGVFTVVLTEGAVVRGRGDFCAVVLGGTGTGAAGPVGVAGKGGVVPVGGVHGAGTAGVIGIVAAAGSAAISACAAPNEVPVCLARALVRCCSSRASVNVALGSSGAGATAVLPL